MWIKTARCQKEKSGKDWTCSKNGLKEGQLRKYWRIYRRQIEEEKDLD